MRPLFGGLMKWAGAGLCVLTAAAWFASGWYAAYMVWSQAAAVQVSVGGGELLLERINPSPGYCPSGLSGEIQRLSLFPQGEVVLADDMVARSRWSWTPADARWEPWAIGSQWVRVALYVPFTILALPTAFLFYRDRRSVRWSREGRCVGCGYDLSGVSGKCPECGRVRE